jgi:hypothetical protein
MVPGFNKRPRRYRYVLDGQGGFTFKPRLMPCGADLSQEFCLLTPRGKLMQHHMIVQQEMAGKDVVAKHRDFDGH